MLFFNMQKGEITPIYLPADFTFTGRPYGESAFGKNLSGDIERAVAFYGKRPFDKGYFSALDLQSCDTAGMDAAPAVDIIRSVRGKAGPVGVAGDQCCALLPGVVGKTLLRSVPAGIVFGGAGGIQHAEMLQRSPEITDEKPGKAPEGGV